MGMPWHQTNPVNERVKFVAAIQLGRRTMPDLCAQFGVSRKTGHKLLERYEAHGIDGLRDRSRAPATHPNQLSPQLEAAILRARKAHPTWGSKKLMVVVSAQWPPEELPARSSVDAVLKRAGVVAPRRARARRQPSTAPQVQALVPNDVWSIDYKGWFRVGDGTRCTAKPRTCEALSKGVRACDERTRTLPREAFDVVKAPGSTQIIPEPPVAGPGSNAGSSAYRGSPPRAPGTIASHTAGRHLRGDAGIPSLRKAVNWGPEVHSMSNFP